MFSPTQKQHWQTVGIVGGILLAGTALWIAVGTVAAYALRWVGVL